MDFSTQVRDIAAKYSRGMDTTVKSARTEVLNRVVARTPKATGAAAAGWEAKVDGETFTISNSVPYIRALEYGHSSQAPNGMVRITMAEWLDIVSKAVRID